MIGEQKKPGAEQGSILIDRTVLEMFAFKINWVPVDKVDDIAEDYPEDCVNEMAQVDPKDYDLAQVEKGIQEIKMDKSLKSLELQV